MTGGIVTGDICASWWGETSLKETTLRKNCWGGKSFQGGVVGLQWEVLVQDGGGDLIGGDNHGREFFWRGTLLQWGDVAP